MAKGEIDFSRAALEGVIAGLCTAATAGAINGSAIMTQTGFIERTIETYTSDLFNQVRNAASFTITALRIGYTAFKF